MSVNFPSRSESPSGGSRLVDWKRKVRISRTKRQIEERKNDSGYIGDGLITQCSYLAGRATEKKRCCRLCSFDRMIRSGRRACGVLENTEKRKSQPRRRKVYFSFLAKSRLFPYKRRKGTKKKAGENGRDRQPIYNGVCQK